MTEHAVTPHAIRRRAYERWLERGSPHGSPEQDWFEAERELADAARADSRAPAALPSPAPLASSGATRRRAPRSIVTRSGTAPAARLLAALVPEAAAPELRSASRGRR
jgi:hypothetical protein